MARFRWWRVAAWGLLLLPVVVLVGGFVAGRAWVNHQLRRDFAFGNLRIHLAAPRLGWDLRFSADSLRVTSPAFTAEAGRLRAEARFWQSLVSLSPSFRVVADTVRVDLPARKGPKIRKPLRLRDKKPAKFPPLRNPVPFRVEADVVAISRGGRPLAEGSGFAFYSQGPKGAAVEWTGARVHRDASGGAAGSAERDPAREAIALDGTFRASARWFGKWVRYQARFQAASGDGLRIEGERRKSDLARGKDSLEASIASLNAYEPLLGRRLPDLSGIDLAASFALDKAPAAALRLDLRAPAPMRIGAQSLSARLFYADGAGGLSLHSRGEKGSDARLEGRFGLPLPDTLEAEALLRAFTGDFTGHTRGVKVPIARWTLPGDFEFRRIRVAGGEADIHLRSRDSTALDVRVFRDTAAAPGKTPWRFSFAGIASPTEPWGRVWTGTNVNWRHAAVTGEWKPGELTVDVKGRQVTAYFAAADSLWARNVIRKRGYHLADSRLYWKDQVWPVEGEVEWGERKAVRGPRGLRLRREVSLAFRASHAKHGRLEYAMPRRRYMEVTAEALALEHLPMPKLERAREYRPGLTGKFAWDWEARKGGAGLKGHVIYAGKRLDLGLEGDWDPLILRVGAFTAAYQGARLKLATDLRLRGKQFHQARKLGLPDVRSLALEAERFEASHLASLLPESGPLEGGTLNGRLSYTDSTGFHGLYAIEGLQLRALRKHLEIPIVSIVGSGRDLVLAARTESRNYPWLNDTLSLKLVDLLGESPGVSLKAASGGGLIVSFDGEVPGFRSLRGAFSAEGAVELPGGAGILRNFRLTGGLSAPLDKSFVPRLQVDSAVVEGRYAVQGIDTQTFRGEVEIRDGRLFMPSLRARDGAGRELAGEAEARLGKPLAVTARLKGEALALQMEGLQKLAFRDVEAKVVADTGGLSATAKAAKASFQSARGSVNARGDLENLFVSFESSARPRAAERGREPISKLGVKARLRNFDLKHEIGFREIQRFFRSVKVDKRRKRIKPMDVNVAVEAVGAENRVETDILRMYFTGELAVRGIYPYTLLTGEVTSLSGEVGQVGQSYDIMDLGLRWHNATMEEGRVVVEGAKKLRVDCKPETRRTCNVFIKLEGRLDEMAFTYDSDCGQTAGGEVIEPAALINSVSRGCYSGDYVSGAGGGGYGEAVFTFLEPTISENLTRRVSKVSAGWIKTTQVSGIGAMVAKDTAANAEPISVGVESREWKGAKVMAKAGYHPEKKDISPWENRVALEWRMPLEKVASDSGWKRRVRDRVTFEASAETRPEEKLEEEERRVRQQVGIRYRFKFWDLW